MIKYIVVWCIVFSVMDNPPIVKDEFGRDLTELDLLYRRHLVYDCEHRKEFFDRDSAFDFYNRAYKVKYDYWYSIGELDSIRIDSIYIFNKK